MNSSADSLHDEEQREVLPMNLPEQEMTAGNSDQSLEGVPLLSRPLFESRSEPNARPNVPVALGNLPSSLEKEQRTLHLAREGLFPVHSPVFSPSDHFMYPVSAPPGSLSQPDHSISVTKSFQVFNVSMQMTPASTPESQMATKSASPISGGMLSTSDPEYESQAVNDVMQARVSSGDSEEWSKDKIMSVRKVHIASDKGQTRAESSSSE